MNKKQLLRNALLSLVMMTGGMQAHAEQVTLAAWDFATNVKYTATATDGNKSTIQHRQLRNKTWNIVSLPNSPSFIPRPER